MKLSEIADIIEGKVEGNADLIITGIGKIETANGNEITFISNPKYEKFFETTKAGCVIVNEDFIIKGNKVSSVIRVNDPYNSFLKLLEVFEVNENESLTGISENSVIDQSAVIGKNVYTGSNAVIEKGCKIGDDTKIFPNVYIGINSIIGKNCRIYPNVTIYRDTEIGDNVIIHSGAVIGSDGFGFAKQKDSSYKKIPQTGNVVIESDAEIGSNTSIDRATIGETRICKGVKLDNQIQIAHNVVIGENTVIAAQVGIAGSTRIGKRCMIGGQSGIVGHLEICDDVVIGAAVGVSKSITEPGIYTGYRVRPYREDLKIEARIKNLDKLEERIKKLESSGN
ncbi:MAG TPA: UDP-3-O-(3-hydroxymyristoyl)glucosamine N-acyltransferase [Ignavibacteria bacterium]|nr:UDP-3-O-(3-hydroxymyristoyl)glucosamine N-acyltransferase [Bacteroidota bacterium]HRI84191.1 UDP-3-O-(3-hydroxymyristoyl)glucosamine N-acyltransferase [Ignavibacteria bacterium]HRJ98344.1 UDP-3-O-(3-hydroxymyristoyl)glucosamine N-acyltransferase [Ignavibacteria bacterium]